MPVSPKRPRLWLRPPRTGKDGSVRKATWIIIDQGKHIATGCAAGETERADGKLAAYLAASYQPRRKERDIETIDVADVLSIYADDCPPDSEADQRETLQRIKRLTLFWGGMMLADVTGESCRRYVKKRGNQGGARRDLEVLRAAINHHAAQGFHRAVVKVVLPDRGKPRDRWLTRSEAAKLLWMCWREREEQRGAVTKKHPLRHLVRFILIGLYTGTRASAIAAASPKRGEGRSYVDLDQGIFYRLAEGQRATNKRQPPVPIPPRLLAHMRRWAALGIVKEHFVEWNGKAVVSVKTGFASAVEAAGLEGRVSPHTLRHTAATWLMQAGVDKWEASGFLGMSVQMLDRVYGHHHPEHLKEAANRIGYRNAKRTQPLVVSLADEKQKRDAIG